MWLDEVPTPAARIREAFGASHRRRYGYAREHLPVEAVNYRVRAAQRLAAELSPPAPARDAKPRLERGRASLDGRPLAVTFAARSDLPSGFEMDGPVVVEEATATTAVPPGWRLEVLETGDLMLERSAS